MNRLTIARARGFSVVELMVSVVIGLLALMFATRLMTGAESNKQAALGGSDSMQNGMQAMFSISADAAQAGYGLNDQIIAGCNTVFGDNEGYELASATMGTATVTPLAAAVIEPNGSNPYRLTLYAGSSLSGTGTLTSSSSRPMRPAAPARWPRFRPTRPRPGRPRPSSSSRLPRQTTCASTAAPWAPASAAAPRACSTSGRRRGWRFIHGRSPTVSCGCARPIWKAPPAIRRPWPTTSSRSRRNTASTRVPTPPSAGTPARGWCNGRTR
jgi:type II secretory pathway pseudopilin PulG